MLMPDVQIQVEPAVRAVVAVRTLELGLLSALVLHVDVQIAFVLVQFPTPRTREFLSGKT